MSPRISELEDHLGYWLRIASNRVSQAFALRAERNGVTVAEWVLLRKLADQGDVAPGKLAAALGLSKGAVSKLADRLVEKRLVSRKADRDDLRQQRLALTAKGRALVPVVAREADENDAEFFEALSQKERAQLRALLNKTVGDRPAPPPLH